ncbi:MAG: bifunctional nicotinamidase/pyrazinamidase [Polyangiaceae bacterium]|nr:bifunctional nicotinamidase/pyrazinamidase [Myxococcales bacterium]MCB9586047.1 bifunctional nicotinamidase/pyrazinamidase [Polyangiaceae bacterium]MCB9608937.1 bifunctional nicotinamidase/pyrazinamidase [Polyangiaceae bacterium]
MQALLLIDLQNDFMPTGSLPVAAGDSVVPVANRIIDALRGSAIIVATQDWHPANHGSFASQHAGKSPGELVKLGGVDQVLWPDHCVQLSHGAQLHTQLDKRSIQKLFYKGTDVGIDSYSAFFDNGHQRATGLGEWLRQRGVREIVTLGLATDFCVKFSVLDALELEFGVTLVSDGCRGVNLEAGDSERAITEMAERGARVVESSALLKA